MDDGSVPGRRPGWHDATGPVHVHPSSLNHPLETSQYHRPYLFYLEKVKTSKTFIRDCTVASPMALLLFGGDLEVAHAEGYVTIDAWIRIRAPAQTAVLVKRLRAALDRLLERQVAAPGAVVEEAGAALVASVVELLVQEEASTQQA